MAGKARLLSDVIEHALLSDETHNEDSTLKDQMNAFKQILIHDITPKGFADVYAQTIAYGNPINSGYANINSGIISSVTPIVRSARASCI